MRRPFSHPTMETVKAIHLYEKSNYPKDQRRQVERTEA
jgi:hypothetical protein